MTTSANFEFLLIITRGSSKELDWSVLQINLSFVICLLI